MSPRESFTLGTTDVRAGRRAQIELPIGKFVTGTPLTLPVLVMHGAHPGPTIWLSAAIHGDEINGVEIIRRILDRLDVAALRGTILAVPVVNVPGFMTGDRYLPDRRDLNRSFPGSTRGSLASRIAKLFLTEIVQHCSVGIDFHTGSGHRTNLAQVRADLDDPRTLALAQAFETPVMIHSSTRDGSLRQAGTELGASVVLFEGGEAWRFDQPSIRIGVAGTLRVLKLLDMIDDAPETTPGFASETCRKSRWVRARRGGLAQLSIDIGDHVTKNDELGRIHDSFGKLLSRITASDSGVVIGMSLDPIVNQGDAIVHIAQIEDVPQ